MFRLTIDPPALSSTYTNLIKQCCINLPSHKEYVGKCLAMFRNEASRLDEYKNFKLTIFSESQEKLFVLKVRGGLGGVTRSKFYVDHGGIYRYDWRARLWRLLRRIAANVFRYALTQGIDIPSQLEYFYD